MLMRVRNPIAGEKLELFVGHATPYAWVDIVVDTLKANQVEIVPYVPSRAEWKVTAGVWALGLMVFTVALKVGLQAMTGEMRAPDADASEGGA